jgi:RNA polymerase sigma-70 factor (ECF subfamily)
VNGEAVAVLPLREPRADWFESLYRTNAADVYAYVAALLGDRSAAEDVTALAFERALRRRRLYNPRRGSMRAWVFGIARNAALDELRRRSRSAPLVKEPAADPPAIEQQLVVRAAVAALAPRDRELILLKFHAQLTNAELGRILGISESNAGTRLHRVLRQLREVCQ